MSPISDLNETPAQKRNWVIPEWRNWWRYHVMRVAFGWAILGGIYMALPAFAYIFSPWMYGALCVFMAVTMMVARMTNQPGVE